MAKTNGEICGLDRFAIDLDVLIRARYPLIAVETAEEQRFRRIFLALAESTKHAAKGVFWWSRVKGFVQVDRGNDRPITNTEDPISALEHIGTADRGLYVLADFGPYVEDPVVQRMLRELAWKIVSKPVTVFFVGHSFPEIPGLAKELTRIDLRLPDENEVAKILGEQIERLVAQPDLVVNSSPKMREQLAMALLGLSANEIESAIAKAAITLRGLNEKAIPLILDEKKAAIRASGALTYSHPEPLSSLGGYHYLRELLVQAAATFSPAARQFGVDPSKGYLLVGLPGCGKDLTKKIASAIFGRPLLDLDMAALFGEGGGVIGSTGASMKRALGLATTLKAVLGISEFEKGVGGMSSSAQSDAGETARTLGMLLNWMQEQRDVFVFATANDVRQLAPEQIRQGRFSQIVFVDLPTEADRGEILAVHLRKRGRKPEDFDLEACAHVSDGFSGAELEAAVQGAILDSFMDKQRSTHTGDVVKRLRSIRPTSEVKAEEIQVIRQWAKDHLAVDVSQPVTKESGERRLEF